MEQFKRRRRTCWNEGRKQLKFIVGEKMENGKIPEADDEPKKYFSLYRVKTVNLKKAE